MAGFSMGWSRAGAADRSSSGVTDVEATAQLMKSGITLVDPAR